MFGGTAAAVEGTMAQRTLACTGCHGQQGRAGPDGYYPRLAGKPALYLYRQLLDFRDGRRHYGLMADLLEPLTDAFLFDMAQHFSALDLPYPAPVPAQASAAELKRGESLATRGDMALKLPACATCHGSALTGVLPAVPSLLGLPRDYINAQLGGWRNGQRGGHGPDCMGVVARRLGPQDVAAVAAWLSSQPVPANAKPAQPLPAKEGDALARDFPGLACPASALPATQNPSLPATPSTVQNATLERGAYLARAGNCMACHTAQGGVSYAGGRAIDTPFGKVFASNLTPDKTHGIGTWNKDDFWQALHFGKSKSGRLLYPAFPYTSFTQVNREDSDALLLYLQSRPVEPRPNTAHQLRWPYNTQMALYAWRLLNFRPGVFEPATDKSAQWNRGAYLVQGLGHCGACHAQRNVLGASVNAAGLAGGLIPMQNWYAPSLASTREAGLATWETGDIVALLARGTSTHATTLGPMAQVVLGSTQYLTPQDLSAMATYLKDLPQTAGAADRLPQTGPVATALLTRGAKLYEKHCAECHGPQGQGVAGIYLPLAGNRAVSMAEPTNLVQVLMRGGFAPATAGNPKPFGMPPFMLMLNDADIGAVLSFIRSNWGNRAAGVTELEVGQIRNLVTH